jgi:hypothetical protein
MGFDSDGNLYVDFNEPLFVSGEDYNMRLTRLTARILETDTIICHVDYQRISDGVSGRFENHSFEPRVGGQQSIPYMQGHFQAMLNNDTPIASPVFP